MTVEAVRNTPQCKHYVNVVVKFQHFSGAMAHDVHLGMFYTMAPLSRPQARLWMAGSISDDFCFQLLL